MGGSVSPLSFFGSFTASRFICSAAHIFVLFILIAHKLWFKAFIEADLSISVYILCGIILFLDSAVLFFYKGEQDSPGLNLLFLAVEALFLSGLAAAAGPVGLPLIFIFVFLISLPLFLSGKIFEPLSFLLYLSIFLPIVFLWIDRFSFEDRMSLAVLTYSFLFFVFCFGRIFYFMLQPFHQAEKDSSEDSLSEGRRLAPSMEMSLELAQKLRPVLNSLIKYFPNASSKERPPSASFFSPEKGREQFNKMREFILNFIEYAEPELEPFVKKELDLKEAVEQTLKILENHPQRPENLTQKTDLEKNIKILGSQEHLEKSFKHILVNAFEALKSQSRPEIYIRSYINRSWAVLEFLDNGHGIESADIQKLFKPLFSKRFGLRGLGLSYTQKVMKAHGAEFSLAGAPERGSVFRIKFPLAGGPYEGYFFKGGLSKREKSA